MIPVIFKDFGFTIQNLKKTCHRGSQYFILLNLLFVFLYCVFFISVFGNFCFPTGFKIKSFHVYLNIGKLILYRSLVYSWK